jgi:hypothetical protein
MSSTVSPELFSAIAPQFFWIVASGRLQSSQETAVRGGRVERRVRLFRRRPVLGVDPAQPSGASEHDPPSRAKLMEHVETADSAPTQRDRMLFEDLSSRLDEQIGLLQELIEEEVAAFDDLIRPIM